MGLFVNRKLQMMKQLLQYWFPVQAMGGGCVTLLLQFSVLQSQHRLRNRGERGAVMQQSQGCRDVWHAVETVHLKGWTAPPPPPPLGCHLNFPRLDPPCSKMMYPPLLSAMQAAEYKVTAFTTQNIYWSKTVSSRTYSDSRLTLATIDI